jgi:hypothetical protein
LNSKRLLNRLGRAIHWRAQLAVENGFSSWAALKNQIRWHFRGVGHAHALPGELIVSLTSYAARFATLPGTLRSLLTQFVRPDRLILWIGRDDEALLPQEVTDLVRHGLEIRVTDDIGPYTKIIPAIKEFPHAFVLTADDDIYYDGNWIKGLVDGVGDSRNVVCYRAHEIRLDEHGGLLPYAQWRHNVPERKISSLFLPTGVGGVLYPPGILSNDVTREDVFLELCPGADDVWLYWMARLNGVSAKTVGRRRRLTTWRNSQLVGLVNENWDTGNDKKIQAMISQFGFPHSNRV